MIMYEKFEQWPGRNLVEQLRFMAERFPGRPAIVHNEQQMSYKEFDVQTDMLASAILQKGVSKGSVIASFFELGPQQFVSLFGILKAGCAYVALDTSYPAERLSYILNDSGTKMLLTNHKNIAQAKELGHDIDIINTDLPGIDVPAQKVDIQGSDLCSIIYTSGSTGTPKGTWFDHRALAHFAWRYSRICEISEHDKVGYFVSVSFSAHAMPMLGAFMNGAALVLFNLRKDHLSTFRDWLLLEKISVALMIPSVLRNFSATLMPEHQFPHLRMVLAGGESLYRADVDKLLPHLSNSATILHMLASTEAYITCAFPIKKGDLLVSNNLPVGWDVADMKTWVIDENGEPCETGKTGEIWIESDFLSGGYWNDENLNMEHFLPAGTNRPFPVFRSGDIGHKQADGTLMLLGRKDNMVKLRGYRIDLREIESVLLDMPETREVAVLPKEDPQGSKHLIAYVVIRDGYPFDESRMKLAVLRMLPDYMVPAFVIRLPDLPKTYSGKIDFQHIPDPDWHVIEKQSNILPPVTDTEIKLAEIIVRMLDVTPVGKNHSIIQLARDSLKLFVALDEIEKAFGKKLNIDAILAAPTIESIARWIDEE